MTTSDSDLVLPPRTPAEETVAELWGEVLGSPPLSVDDDLFAAGGDSIQAAGLVARVRAHTGATVTLEEFVAAPTVSALAALVDRAAPSTETSDLTVSAEGELASYAQERFWFIDQASGSNTVSNVSWALRLRGALDADRLSAALDAVAARHENLRTRFVERDGVAVQIVDLPAAIPFDRLTAADEGAAAELASAAARVPFDLSTGPLFRVQLIQLGDDDHVLHFVAHHIVCDDWSKRVLMAELGTLAGGGSLDTDPVQYSAYSRWQREQLGDGELAQELAHWQGRLAGASPALELPTDAPRPTTPSLRGARLRTSVPSDVADGLRALGRTEGATFFMTLLAAFEVLLMRYTAQDDVVIGTAVDNRGLVELEQAIGLYTNVLALRGDLSGRPTFRELLARARETTLDAIAHQDLPFDRLAAVAPDRDPSRHPVFQAFYEFIIPAPMELPLPGVSVEPFEVPKLTAEFDLGLYMDEQHGGLDAVWEYATDLYNRGTIDRLAGHFLTLLAEIVADPDRAVDELPLLSDTERAALEGWNETGEMVGRQPVHERFASIAGRRPDDPALVAGDVSWNYGELERRANQYAHQLQAIGISPDDAVGISLPRNVELIAAMLGVLKAGGAYVPLNPDHPPARLLAQLELADARVLVSDTALEGFTGAILAPDDPQLDTMDDTAPSAPSSLTSTAYILFTSGSTGVPKGVAVTHGNLANYTEDMIGRLGAEGLRFGSVSAVSTDLGNTAIFPALAGGGCLHLVPTDVATDADQFAAYVAEHPLDVLKITPSLLATLLDAAGSAQILPRQWLIVGGEAFSWALAERLFALGCAASDGSGPRLLNHYGPTEATIGCCTYELKATGERLPSATVPIGLPITGDTAHVLDALGEPVPLGVPGELVIGGAGVASGYVGDSEKTTAVFLEVGGERRYHTGDLARRLPTGELEFLGRADQQVKIRGYRVEPAEVAAFLERRDEIAQAAVLAVGEGEARHLIAFIVGGPSAGGDIDAVRAGLAEELPAYMVPSGIVPVAELPLTPSGKLDRVRLLAEASEATPAGASSAEGTGEELTGLEAELAEIWQELLDHQVGLDDNFFESGGHSLLAIRLVARLRGDMKVTLSLKALMEAPTIRLLAEAIEAKQGGAAPAPAEKPAPAPEPEPVAADPEPVAAEPELAPGEAPPITPAPRDRPLRSSFIQEQLWLVDQLTPGSAAYNFSWPMHVRGALDVPALERALNEFVRRHEAMRTRLVVQDELLVEVVDPAQPVTLAVTDLQADQDPESAALRKVADDTAQPFDLAAGPLYRFGLMRITPEHHVFQVIVHHAVFDGVSKVVLYEELGRLYDAYAAGADPALDAPAVQYADFAEWQRNWLTDEHLAGELEHWREQLAGAPTTLEIPGDRSRPPVATLRGARLRSPLSAELRSALENLARAQGATFFTAALAAYAVLLARYSGQQELVVGAPVDTRSRPELAHVVGPFINTVVLRTDLSGSPSFRELLRRVQLSTLDAVEHQSLPFERLVEALAPERDLSRHPIFQALLALNPPEHGLALNGLSVEDIDPPWASSRVDLFLILDDLPTGMEAIWEYSTDLFDPETVERMASHFTALLGAIVADPDRPVDELELLSESERDRLTSEWNRTTIEFPGERLEALIAAQAARTPDAVAVVFEDRSISYAELDARGNQLAHHLRELGVGAGDLVGICLPRSERMLVALLGTLKSGGAYVPIDPAYPAERQRYMLEDADVAVLLTESGVISDVPSGPYVLRLDAEAAEIDGRPETPAAPVGGQDDLAYVIYTSGSTGQPKGVQIPHRALVNFLTTMAQRPGLTREDRLVAVTTLSFDIAGLELYLPLVTGARVVVASAETAADPTALASLLQESGATAMQATPTTWRMLVDSGWNGTPSLKALCGGEALPPGLADELIARGLDLWNMYGPTETTIWSTCAHLTEPGQRLTIGRPIGNTSLYILDRSGAPAPIGVPGELLIGGAGLASGYRNRAELTAERFIPDPFSGEPEARLYRTGDLARYRPDGSVEYLGRLDHQIKLRGFRIELGEIESRLAEQPSVSAAAATVHTSAAGEPALAAYVVGSGATVDLDALRRVLAESLPAYMVPSSLMALDALPMTPNGKVDRNALPKPEGGSTRDRDHVAPRTPTEEAVAEIWREVLGLESVGVTDDFFDLGGQSLLAVRLVRRMRSRFDVDLSVRRLFEGPTVAGLAHYIAAETGAPGPVVVEMAAPRAESPRDSLPALTAAVRTRRPSYAQERFWFIEQVSGGSGAYNIAWPTRLRGRLDVPALQRALTEIVRRHEVLRTRFVEQDGRPVALVDPPGAVNLAFTDLTGSADQEAALRSALDTATAAPFDIAAGPVLRTELLRLGQEDHVLQVVVHHIVADGGSKAIFFAELAALYAAAVENRPSTLAEPLLQYGDFADWQVSWLEGERLERELSHWTDVLAGAPTALELPGDRPRPPVASLRGAWHRRSLPPKLLADLQTFAQANGLTLFMVLLGGYEVLLHRYSRQADLLVGTPVDTRSRAELEAVIGPFVNSVVVRSQVDPATSTRDLLAQARDRTLDAIEHQELPFERLVETMAPDRDLSRHPIFQAQIALNPPEPPISLAGLAVEELETAKTTSRVDLTLLLQPQPGGLDTVWEYSTDLFDAAVVEQMAEQFVAVLGSIVADPEATVESLALLTDSERAELLARSTQGAGAFETSCLHERFEAQAQATPEAVAVTHEGRSLTYGELNARANRLAHLLRRAGVEPDTLVALSLERSLDLVVAIVAVLKAGGGYLPLDPEQPADRVEFILRDSNAPVLITTEALLDRLPLHEARTVCLDRDSAELEAESPDNPGPVASPDHLAYVIYTSGSTGQPKGVEVEHRHVSRLFAATDSWLHPGQEDTWTLLHSYAFDFSVWELWGALLHGGRLVVVPGMTARTPDALARLIAEEGVTIFNATPSLFMTAIDDMIAVGDDLALRYVIFGGEALQPRLLRGWFDRFGDVRPTLVNMYGITETTVHVTYRPLTAADATRDGSPIGEPLPDLQLYLLDDHLAPVPVGIPGELYVGGAGVTRGYLNRPELTAERFIANPFGDGRLYRTGDGGRWSADGNLLYEGRLDDQVKIRGFRIELGEIQSALSEHPQVDECAVITRDDGRGLQLAAYVVLADDAGDAASTLREWVRGKLPEYMVPATFTVIPALPLTGNGKLDRRALPEPAAGAAGGAAPATPTERALAEIFAELLGDREISVDDDFFAIGGHSLLAAQLVARIRARFEVPFPVRAAFESPTIAELARAVDGELGTSDSASAGPESSVTSPPDIPRRRPEQRPALSYSQQQLWLIDQWDPGTPTYNVALLFRVRGVLDLEALGNALRQLIARHEVLRTVVEVHDDEPVPTLLERPTLDLQEIDLRDLPADEAEAEGIGRATELSRRPFDFTSDPLLRATVVLLGNDDALVGLETHHIAFDGWSERLLLDELATLYRGRSVPDLPIQFIDFAVWQREWLSGATLDHELDFWRRHLAGAKTSIELPADHPRPEGRRFRGESHDIALDRAAAQAAAALMSDESVTPYMLGLAALSTLLYRITGQDDILIGSPAANRSSVELETVMGFVSNTLTFRVRLGGNPTFRELLHHVRDMALDVYSHQGVPLEKVVEAVRPEREPGVNPLFQVNLRVSGSRRTVLDLPGTEITPLKIDSGYARFDLALDLDVLGEAIEGYFRYNRDIFEPATIAKLAAEFRALMERALTEPDTRLLSFGLTQDWTGPARPSLRGLRQRTIIE